jgi:hypothetical protein
MKLKNKYIFINSLKIKQIVIKTTMIKYKKKIEELLQKL